MFFLRTMINIIFILVILVCNAALQVYADVGISNNGGSGGGGGTVTGNKSNNGGAPGSTNLGVLPCVATVAPPTYTEGNQVGCSTDLNGNTRVSGGGGGTAYTASGTLTALNSTVELTLNEDGAFGIQLSGTWVGTVTFQGTLDNSTWSSVGVVPSGQATTTTTATANGLWQGSGSGLLKIRANMTAYTSGTATVNLKTVPGEGRGSKAVAATILFGNIVLNLTSSGSAYANLRNNSGTEVGTSTDPLRIDPTGSTTQPVSVATLPLPSGAATEATLSTLNGKIPASPSTDRTTAAAPFSTRLSDGTAFYKATTPSDTQPISASSLPLPSGASTLSEQQTQTTALQLIDNLPLTQGSTTSGQSGVLIQGAVTTSPPSYTTGQTSPLSLTTGGLLRVDPGTVTITSNSSVNVNQIGGTGVVAGACETEQPIYINISQTTGTQLITGTSSERIYICSLQLLSATAQNVALVDGTGTVCATGVAGMLGGSTAATGWNFAANNGLVLPFHRNGWSKTSSDADNVCLLQSGSGQISGSLSYVSRANLP